MSNSTNPTPPLVSIDDYAKRATELMPIGVAGFYNGAAGAEITLQDNCSAFDRIQIRPRHLRDVSQRSTACEVLGHQLRTPIAIAPTGLHRMAHPDGEVATARAAAAAGTIFTMSTMASVSIEDVAAAVPADVIRWFQLYVYRDRRLTERLVRRAEAAGCTAIVLTVDVPVMGTRRRDARNQFKMPDGIALKNFESMHENGLAKMESTSGGGTPSKGERGAFVSYTSSTMDASLTWRDVQWLIQFTKLPVIVKGILTAEDARLAADYGCAGVVVSNHGGRQLDTVLASIDALPAIVEAVGDRLVVMMDGGIRNGTDVFKALALGARCVFIGRPVLWGLAVGGQNGVEDVLRILRDELDCAMAVSGVVNLAEIGREYVQLPTDGGLQRLGSKL